MLTRLLIAWCLMAACVAIHAGGIFAAMRWLPSHTREATTWLFVQIAGWIILLHLVEISLWSLWYAATGSLPDLETASYFSALTYTTTGYGDVVLPEGWRLVSGIEALTGILMCGWSTAFFFAVFIRIHESRTGGKRAER